MLAFAFIGSITMNFANEMNGFTTYTALSILGIGMSGLLTASLYLVNEFSTPENRGYITGLQTLIGIFGIAIETFIGAVLYEFVNRNGPFNLFGVTCLIGMVMTILIYWRWNKNKKNPSESNLLV
jgi:MFS family permease